MNPDYLDPAVGLPLAALLWAVYAYMIRKAHR